MLLEILNVVGKIIPMPGVDDFYEGLAKERKAQERLEVLGNRL